MKELTFAIVKWEDACENNSPETDRVYAAIPILVTYSCGHVIFENNEMITLSRDYFPAPTEDHDDTVRRKLTIPKSNIKMIKKITVDF